MRKPTSYQDELLTILGEECAEVIQAASKIKRFGLDHADQEGQNGANIADLNKELGDILGMIRMLQECGLVAEDGILEDYAIQKTHKVKAHMKSVKTFEYPAVLEYIVLPYDRMRRGVEMVTVTQRCFKPEAWAITKGTSGSCLNRDGDWEYEGLSSNRTEEFLERCRWPTAREAIEFAREHLRQYPSGYKSWE